MILTRLSAEWLLEEPNDPRRLWTQRTAYHKCVGETRWNIIFMRQEKWARRKKKEAMSVSEALRSMPVSNMVGRQVVGTTGSMWAGQQAGSWSHADWVAGRTSQVAGRMGQCWCWRWALGQLGSQPYWTWCNRKQAREACLLPARQVRHTACMHGTRDARWVGCAREE